MPTKIKGTTGVDKVEAGAVITNPSFSGNATVSGSLTVGGVNVFSGPYRNLLINGDMQIAQRGTSVTGKTTGGYDTVDRWRNVIISAGTWTQTQSTDVPSGQGFVSSIKMQCTTADASLSGTDQVNINQIIEAQNLQHLKYGTAYAEKLTLSFWVKSNKTGTYVAWFYQEDDGRQTNKTYTINTADTWEKKTITINGDTTGIINNDNGQGMEIRFVLGTGSDYTSGTSPNGTWEAFSNANAFAGQTVNLADSTSNYINITGVQLEVGEGASDFEFLPYDVQLARCQRYYEKSCAYATVPTNGVYDVEYLALSNYVDNLNCKFQATFKVEKRATPGITLYGGATGKWQTAKLDGSWGTIFGSSYPVSTTTKYLTVNNSDWNGSSSWQTITAGTGRMTRGVWVADSEL